MRYSIVIFLIFVVAASPPPASAGPKQGGTLIWGRAHDSSSLDPALIHDGESSKVTANIFEGLVRYCDDGAKIEPALASRWTVSDDGKIWNFSLRKNVFFHDGSEFNAEAVVFSIRRQIDPGHPYYRDDFPYSDSTFKYVRDVEAVDTHTVKITLETAYAPFQANLAMSLAAPVISPAALKKWKADFATHPSGTGPFRFKQWIPGDRIILEKNDRYWGTPPHLDRLIFKTIPNIKSRLSALRSRALHGMDGLDAESAKIIESSAELKMETRPGMNVAYLAMNTQKSPFHLQSVRQAVNHAINKQNLVKWMYQDMAIPAKNPIPPVIWGYNDTIEDYDYNPDKARKLLASAGFPDGFDTTLWAMPVARPYMPQPQKMAAALRSNLRAVGVNAEIVTHDWKTYLNKTSNGEHDMCLLGWVGSNGDPDNFLYTLLDGDNAKKPKATNVSFFSNNALHDLLIRAQQSIDPQTRAKLYRNAQKVIHEQAPWAPLAHSVGIIGLRKTVHGVFPDPMEDIRFSKAWID